MDAHGGELDSRLRSVAERVTGGVGRETDAAPSTATTRVQRVLAIDPGYEQSAYLLFNGQRITEHGIKPNIDILESFRWFIGQADVIVLEQIESFGMAVGREVFETVFWTGRFFEAAREVCVPQRMPRKAVKIHLCQSARAQDSNIRTALCDRFGGKDAAIGKKKTPGPLYGIKSHEWAALAIAVTWFDQHATPTLTEAATVNRLHSREDSHV